MIDIKTTDNISKVKKGANFTAYEGGALNIWPDHSVELPGLGEVRGKQFLKDLVGFTGCEISINSLPPGGGMPFYHQHQENEEVYIFIKGKGQMQIDGDSIDVQEGSIVRIGTKGQRTWRNNSNEPLFYIVMQTRENSLRQYTLGDGIVAEKEVAWTN